MLDKISGAHVPYPDRPTKCQQRWKKDSQIVCSSREFDRRPKPLLYKALNQPTRNGKSQPGRALANGQFQNKVYDILTEIDLPTHHLKMNSLF